MHDLDGSGGLIAIDRAVAVLGALVALGLHTGRTDDDGRNHNHDRVTTGHPPSTPEKTVQPD
ncbi:MAG TPA: hypothetical protein VG034_06780 [Acidimicrobiia bacterium]|nr:hypothetical protein [Acidimicrobiia bacterium]